MGLLSPVMEAKSRIGRKSSAVTKISQPLFGKRKNNFQVGLRHSQCPVLYRAILEDVTMIAWSSYTDHFLCLRTCERHFHFTVHVCFVVQLGDNILICNFLLWSQQSGDRSEAPKHSTVVPWSRNILVNCCARTGECKWSTRKESIKEVSVALTS